MKNQKILSKIAMALITLSSTVGQAGMFLPEMSGAIIYPGISVWSVTPHICTGELVTCVAQNALPDLPYIVTSWFDPGFIAATGIDLAASSKQFTRTIKAKDAIKKLKKALEGGCGGKTTGDGDTSGDDTLATVYAPDEIQSQIDVTEVPAERVFKKTRENVQEYLFSTPDDNIKGKCNLGDSKCATQRQNEWLLASVTLASSAADKVLDMTVKKAQIQEEGESQGKNSDQEEKTVESVVSSLKDHFEKLANNFNEETAPTGLYNRMADIVLDTHRQTNDANALLGRDLEATGLRIINETGPKWRAEAETEE